MKELFPIEILQENTIENHFVKRDIRFQIIYCIIFIILIGFIISLPFIDVDVTSQSRGIIRSNSENKIIQSAISGEVVKTNIFENKLVHVGDTLLWLRTDELEEQIIRLNQRILENNDFINDLSNLIKGVNIIKTSKYKMQLAVYKGRLLEKEISLKQANSDYDVSKKLFDKGVEAKVDYEQVKSRLNSEQSQMNLLTYQQLSAWEVEKTNLEQDNKNLYSDIQQIEKRKTQYILTAPTSGYIIDCAGIDVGSFITPNQNIAKITSVDNLLLECYVSPKDIGYIKVDQNIKLQVDAFNYQQWGMLEGKVSEIIPDITQVDNQSFFRVRCILDKYYLELPNGYKGELKKGMSGTTRFHLISRSLFELLFDDINDWINPKILQYEN